MNCAATAALLASAPELRNAHKVDANDRSDVVATNVHQIGIHDPLPDGVTRVRFASMVLLDKQEAFEACSIIASARDRLATIGYVDEAEELANLFAILESRLLCSAH